jgi:hypothetical protein
LAAGEDAVIDDEAVTGCQSSAVDVRGVRISHKHTLCYEQIVEILPDAFDAAVPIAERRVAQKSQTLDGDVAGLNLETVCFARHVGPRRLFRILDG